jgi:hypothetical protein
MEMIARLVSVKLPSGDEGQKPIARFELHDRERGQLLLPYDDKMGSLGSVFRVNIENFERISVKDYLDILPLGIRIKGDTTEFPGVF